MLISIQDVPPYERHLLFCSQLDHAHHRRRHSRRVPNVPVLNRSLTVCHEQVAAEIAYRGRLG